MDRGAIVYGPFVLMVDPALNPHEMYDWGGLELLAPKDAKGVVSFQRPAQPVAGRRRFSVPGACFKTLARGLRLPKKVGRNILDPARAESESTATQDAKTPPLSDNAWRIAFLVPISELTGRRTVTLNRMAPYEVRNDIRFVNADQRSEFDTRTTQAFETLRESKWLNTSGYLIGNHIGWDSAN
jgi:hypothetical protein